MDETAAPAEASSATQRAYRTLRGLIVTGQIRPGEKLKIDSLRQRLGTGASPIREALSLLTSDNLVERIDQRGFRAADASLANFSEILALRCNLEGVALRESLAHASEPWEEALVLSHHRMARAQKAGDPRFETLHRDFHMTLLSGAPSPILLKFCGQLYDLNIRYRFLAGGALNYSRRDVSEEHAEILEAALARDADLAAERLLGHYRRTGAYLTELLSDGALGTAAE